MPDFVRRFCQLCPTSEAYAVRTLMKFGCELTENQPQRQVQEKTREDITYEKENCVHGAAIDRFYSIFQKL